MADERMEISSDLGANDHGMADDYLDLDIDLTTGHPEDEDFILDDADQGEPQTVHSSPHAGADDIMLDEEENADQMYDDEPLDDEQEHNMEDEAPSHSFVTVNDAYVDYSENTGAFAAAGDDANDINELGDSTWAQDDDTLALDNPDVDEQLHNVESVERGTVEYSTFQHREMEAEDHIERVSNGSFHSTSPRQVSQEEDLAIEEPGSPSTSNHSHQSVSRPGSAHSSHPDPSDLVELNEGGAETAQFDDSDSPTSYGISVIYRETQYSLFGTSGLDDPDSFFLSDLGIADKPISEFFKGIRNVIHEDVSEEEELCVTIKHLGLDIEEISCPLHDVTLSQILDLHEKLLLNDEITSLDPLCIHLHTRTSFAKRLANLLAGAAAGKGLSELVAWDEHSEQYNNSGEGTETHENYGAPQEDEFEEEHLDHPTEGHKLLAQDDEQYSVDHADDQDLPEQDDLEYGGNIPKDQEGDEDSIHNEQALDTNQQTDTLNADMQSKEHRNNSGVEEEDLIDYSEDEVEAPKIPTDKGRKKTANYEALNEELRRRSLSRSAELRARTATPDVSREVYTEETFTTVEAEAGNDTLNTEDWNAVEGEDDEYNEGDNAEGHDGLDSNDYLDLSAGAEPAEEKSYDNGDITGLDVVADAEVEGIFEDDVDYISGAFGGSVSEHQEITETQNLEYSNGSPKNIGAEVSAEFGLDSNSSATASLNDGHDDEGFTFDEFDDPDQVTMTGDQKPAVEAVVEDEIDYDDDDYAGDLATPPGKTEHSISEVVPNSGSGKRSWQDLDDDATTTNNDAKRVRS